MKTRARSIVALCLLLPAVLFQVSCSKTRPTGVMTIDDTVAVEWAYIPHFYFNFYVYQYATSIAAASLLAQDVLSGRKGALENYLDLISAGGSDYPYELLKRAGVDMATPEPYRTTITRMNKIMDQIEEILDTQQLAALETED